MLIISCSSTSNLPRWVTRPETSDTTFAVIAKGFGESESSAREVAILDALREMSEGLGYDITGLYYRELSWSGRISDFRATIANNYSYEEDGGYYYYLMLVVDSERYQERRNDDLVKIEENGKEVGNLLDKAALSYKNNEDISSLSYTLEALRFLLTNNTDLDEKEKYTILSQAMEYLSNITLRVSGSTNRSSVDLKAVRNKGVFKPAIENGYIDVLYPVSSDRSEKVTIKTDSKGIARFERTNPHMLRKGELVFQIHLPESVEVIERVAEDGFLDDFYALYNTKTIKVNYDDAKESDKKRVFLNLVSYGFTGDERDEKNDVALFAEALSSFPVLIIEGDGSKDNSDYIMSLSLYVTDNNSAFGEVFLRVEGSLEIVDSLTKEEKSYDIFAIGKGENWESAEDDAVANAILTAAETVHYLF